MFKFGFALLLALTLVGQISGLFFYMYEGERKCFMEEVPEDTVIVGKYKLAQVDQNSNKPTEGSGNSPTMSVFVTNPQGGVVMNKEYNNNGNSFSFVAQHSGEHVICLSMGKAGWGYAHKLRVDFNVLIGEESNDYLEIARKGKLDDLQLRVKQLLDQLDQISKEQSYQRVREARFRQTSESTNWRVVYWSCIQLSILLASGFWQMKHLRNFFEAKKLV